MDDDNRQTILDYSAPATESPPEDPPPIRRFGALLLATPLFVIGLFATVGGLINVVGFLASRDVDNAMGSGLLIVGVGCLYLTHRLGRRRP